MLSKLNAIERIIAEVVNYYHEKLSMKTNKNLSKKNLSEETTILKRKIQIHNL